MTTKIIDADHFYILREEFVSGYGRGLKDIMEDELGFYIITDPEEGEMEDGRVSSFGNGKKIYLPVHLQEYVS